LRTPVENVLATLSCDAFAAVIWSSEENRVVA
jgi:hypothetical protein